MSTSPARSATAIVLLAALSCTCLAQERPTILPLDPNQRSISLDVISGQRLPATDDHGPSRFVSPSIAFARPLSKRFEGSIILLPALLVNQPTTQPPRADRQTVWAAGLDLGLRFYPAPSDWRCVPFLDVIGGVIGATHRIPARGTNFNFNLQAGAGMLLPTGKSWHPFVLVRWHHISNANFGNRNPSWDQWAVGLGAKFDFKLGKPSGS